MAQPVLRIQAPIWAHLPQSPQAAEYCALAAACELIGGEATIFGDCANVIRDAQLPPVQATAPRKLYAGITRVARAAPFFAKASVVKVPAHVTETDDMEPDERFRVRGNTAADSEAKAAFQCHAHAFPEVRKSIGRTVGEARHVIAVAAALLPLWSCLPKGLKKAPQPERAVSPLPSPQEVFQVAAPVCLTPGPWKNGIVALKLNCQKHRLSVLTFDAYTHQPPVVACAVCGCYASDRFEHLMIPCISRSRHRPASAIIRRVACGFHPTINLACRSAVSIVAF